ncbi:MAG: diguanylate cyclase [bacterium]|nr:diguanylate cyclase [bacterium]
MENSITNKISLLTVYDGSETARMIDRIIKKHQHRFSLEQVHSGYSAINTIKEKDFDCILLDNNLPDTSGIEIIEKIKKMNITIPVIIFTGENGEDFGPKAIKAGAFEYFSKPLVDVKNLFDFLLHSIQKSVLQKKNNEKRKKAKKITDDAEERFRDVIDSSPLMVLRFLPGDKTITFVNEGCCNYLNMDRIDILGESLMKFVPESDQKRFHDLLYSLSPEDPTGTYENYSFKNNEKRYLVWTVQGLFDHDSSIIEYQAIGGDWTDLKLAEEIEWFQSEWENFATTLRSIDDGIITTDTERKVVLVNRIAEEVTGWKQQDAIGMPVEKVFNVIYEDGVDVLNGSLDLEPILVACDGEKKHITFSYSEVNNKQGENIGDIIVFNDITDKKRMEKELYNQRVYLQSILDSQSNMIIVADKNEILHTNESFLDFFNYQKLDDFRKRYTCVTDVCIESEGYISKSKENHWIETVLNSHNLQNLMAFQPNGFDSPRIFSVHVSKLSIDEERYVIVFSDVTQLERRTQDLEKKATLDSLTKVYNRRKFNEILAQQIEAAKICETDLSLIFFDIDNFKKINDTYGHQVGDIILIMLTNAVKTSIRKTDLLARWGGEEFITLLPCTNLEDARKIAEKVRGRVEEINFDIVGTVTCSFGVTIFDSEENIDNFIERADKALYRAKENGRNRVETS